MIIVTIELKSAITKKTTKLGELRIANDGTSTDDKVMHYDGKIMTKPTFMKVTREGKVMGHRRHDLTIWHLVAKMLRNMGYLG
ncbi:hypothetical protein EVC30_049 [Rhizobium phage RHph_Y1_11]|nr:hypothetical protein EVC30_049 [Rhizobium phage RHph_Y1_11]